MNPMYSGHCTFERPTNQIASRPPEGVGLTITFADRKGGFPHSEMSGSKGARASPDLIAACHVLHRLSTPRHPSEALMRLIVLSKAHARIDTVQSESPRPQHACASYLSDYMMSSRIQPERWNPSIHDVRCRRQPEPGRKLMFSAIAPSSPKAPKGLHWDRTRSCEAPKARGRMVEPDGIEPTTSCLQSTRSTN